MICPNCGNECSEEELFCRKCGTKIATYANVDTDSSDENDGSISDGYNDIVESTDEHAGDLEIVEDEVPNLDPDHEIGDNLANAEVPEELGSIDEDELDVEGEDDLSNTGEIYSSERAGYISQKDSKNKNKILILAIVAAVLLSVFTTWLVINVTSTAKFNKYYALGVAYYDKGKYDYAVTNFRLAASNAFSRQQKIKSYEKVYETDEKLNNNPEEEIAYMKALIDLDDDNVDYYKKLIILYQNNGQEMKIKSLIEDAPADVQQALKGFDGTIPVANPEPGSYDKPIDVELKAPSNVTVYYTIDGSMPTDGVAKKKYTAPIRLRKEGTYTIRAVSINKNNKESKEFVGKYVLNFNAVSAPTVTPDSGKYHEQRKIEATCDAGCSIYYTTDGSTPTIKSKKYTKPIKMKRGTSLYYFIAINPDGVISKVVTRAYEFSPDYKYSYDDALRALRSQLMTAGIMENDDGTYENKDVAYLTYLDVTTIDGEFYYLIKFEKEGKKQSSSDSQIYAVSCDSGECYKAEGGDSGYDLTSITDD